MQSVKICLLSVLPLLRAITSTAEIDNKRTDGKTDVSSSLYSNEGMHDQGTGRSSGVKTGAVEDASHEGVAASAKGRWKKRDIHAAPPDDPRPKLDTKFPGNYPQNHNEAAVYRGYGYATKTKVLELIYRSPYKTDILSTAWGSPRYLNSTERKTQLTKDGMLSSLLKTWSPVNEKGTADFSHECALSEVGRKIINYGRRTTSFPSNERKCRRLVLPFSFQSLASDGENTDCTKSCNTRAHADYQAAFSQARKSGKGTWHDCQARSGSYLVLQYAELNPLDLEKSNFTCVCAFELVMLRIHKFKPGYTELGKCDACRIQHEIAAAMPAIKLDFCSRNDVAVSAIWQWMPSDYPFIADTHLHCLDRADVNHCHGDNSGHPKGMCNDPQLTWH